MQAQIMGAEALKKSGKFFAGLAFVVIWILFPPQIVDAQSGIAEIGEKVWSLFDHLIP